MLIGLEQAKSVDRGKDITGRPRRQTLNRAENRRVVEEERKISGRDSESRGFRVGTLITVPKPKATVSMEGEGRGRA